MQCRECNSTEHYQKAAFCGWCGALLPVREDTSAAGLFIWLETAPNPGEPAGWRGWRLVSDLVPARLTARLNEPAKAWEGRPNTPLFMATGFVHGRQRQEFIVQNWRLLTDGGPAYAAPRSIALQGV